MGNTRFDPGSIESSSGSDATEAGPLHVVASEELEPGARVGSYTITGTIGKGGWGTVYFASRDGDGQKAAVKVLHGFLADQPLAAERFFREVQALDRIKHPSMVEIYQTGRLPQDGRPYFVMELLQGSNLRAMLQAEGRMSIVETFEIVEQVCRALDAAHAAGVIHRDLKAENVIVAHDRRVVLVDFGLAKLLEPDPSMPGLTTTQQQIGTLIAMAPEQIRTQTVDRRTDIYGLGVMVYNMLTGVFPFRGTAEEVVRLHLECVPRPPSAVVSLSAALDAVVLRCLEKDPAARFQTVRDFIEAFRGACFGAQAPTRPRAGVGVLVSVVAAADAGDDALADAVLALDEAEAGLRGAGYQIRLRTSRELLGVRISPAAADEELAGRRQAVELAHALHASLSAMVAAGVRVAVTVHSADVHVREGTDDILGGKLLEVPDWSWPHDTVVVTSTAGAGLSRG